MLVFGALILAGCGEQNPPQSAENEPEAGADSPSQAAATDARLHRPGAAPPLQQLEQRAGLKLSSGAKVLTHGSGVPDPSIGFYEWLVFSSELVVWPDGHESSVLPVRQAAEYLEAKMAPKKIEGAQSAIGTKWESSGFEFSATRVQAPDGEYFVVQQFRKQ